MSYWKMVWEKNITARQTFWAKVLYLSRKRNSRDFWRMVNSLNRAPNAVNNSDHTET